MGNDLLPSVTMGDTVTMKQILAGEHGLTKRFYGLIEKGEGVLSPSITVLEGYSKGVPVGSLVYQYTKSGVVYTKMFRLATSVSAVGTTYKTITLTVGQGGRFRVGDIVAEVTAAGVFTTNLGAIVEITPEDGSTGEILKVTTAPTLLTGSIIVGVPTDATVAIPTLAGITYNYVEAVDTDAPVAYLKHAEIIKSKITWYADHTYVLNKLKTDIPMMLVY